MTNNTRDYYSPKQGRLPLFITDFLDICDLLSHLAQTCHYDRIYVGVTKTVAVRLFFQEHPNTYQYSRQQFFRHGYAAMNGCMFDFNAKSRHWHF